MANDCTAAHVILVGSSAGNPCGDECVASRSKKRRMREARRAGRDAQIISIELREYLCTKSGDHSAFNVVGKLPAVNESLPGLTDLWSLWQNMSQRLGGIEQCLAVSCGYAQLRTPTARVGVSAEVLVMQCNATRKIQSWFRRNPITHL